MVLFSASKLKNWVQTFKKEPKNLIQLETIKQQVSKSTSTSDLIQKLETNSEQQPLSYSITGLAFDGKLNQNKTVLTLWDIGGFQYVKEVIDLNKTEALIVLEALKQLDQFLQDDQETDGHLFTKLLFVRQDYEPAIKLKLKCARYISDGKIVAFLQVDYWNEELNRWIYGKKHPQSTKVHVVRLIDNDYIKLSQFITSHFC